MIVLTYCDSEMTSSVMAMDAKGCERKVGEAGEELGVETSEKVAPTGDRPAELGEDEVMLRQGRVVGEDVKDFGVSGRGAARVVVSRGGMALGMRLRGGMWWVQREAAAEGRSSGRVEVGEEEEEEDRWTVV